MILEHRALGVWPGPKTKHPVRAQFNSTWSQTLEMLEREVTHLGCRGTVICAIDVPDSAIRIDGGIKANARPISYHGVVISFDSARGRLSFPSDKYNAASWAGSGKGQQAWHCNVRAVAMTLDALRAVERYGVKSGAQYSGFRELGTGTPMVGTTTTETMSTADALAFLERHADLRASRTQPLTVDVADTLYRRAIRRVHPDIPDTGSAELFARATLARDVLYRSTR